MKRAIRYWLFVIAFLLILFAFSDQPVASASEWIKVLRRFLPLVGGQPSDARGIVIAVRKSLHFLSYAGFATAFALAWRFTWSRWRVLARHWLWVAFLVTAAVASLDEWNQSRLPSRSGRIEDVLIDSVGAVLALVLLRSLFPMRQEKRPHRRSRRYT